MHSNPPNLLTVKSFLLMMLPKFSVLFQTFDLLDKLLFYQQFFQ